MPSILRGSLKDILTLLAAYLANATGLPAARVKAIARPEKQEPKFTAPQDILLRFKGFQADTRNGARHDCRLVHRLHVTVRTRLEFDEADQDLRWLADPAAGNVVAWEKVADAVQQWFPADPQNNLLSIAGLYLLSGEESQKSDEDLLAWGETTLVFGVLVEAPLSQLAAGLP